MLGSAEEKGKSEGERRSDEGSGSRDGSGLEEEGSPLLLILVLVRPHVHARGAETMPRAWASFEIPINAICNE